MRVLRRRKGQRTGREMRKEVETVGRGMVKFHWGAHAAGPVGVRIRSHLRLDWKLPSHIPSWDFP